VGELKRRFRIEGSSGVAFPAAMPDADAHLRHQEILRAIGDLRAALAGGGPAADVQVRAKELAEYTEALELKVELQAIQAAIADTKRELATLHEGGLRGQAIANVSDELDAIVLGTEQATEEILSATEVIEERAANLSAKLRGDNHGMVSDIQEQSIRILEACNFQDLTGQRISKIVTAFRFIDQRVSRMVEIWGGMEALAGQQMAVEMPTGDRALLNGPALEGDEGRASQADIDVLFG